MLVVLLAASCSLAAAGQAGAAHATPTDVREALTLEKEGKAAEAAAAWKKVVTRDPKNAQAFAQLGLLEARLEHYDAALAAYRAAQKLKPAMPGLEMNYGLALFKSEHYKEAAELFESALQQHPEAPEAARLTMLAGMSYYGARDYEIAAGYLKTAAASDPKNLPLLLALGHCYLWTKQLDATMAVYKQILDINPDSAEADMIAGEALDEKGDNAGSVAQFQAAVKANPKEPQAHFGLAYLYWTQKRYEEAVPEFKAELANDPRNSLAMIYLADTYVQQARYDLAQPVLEQALRLKPEVPLIHLDMGIVLMETNRKQAAVAELNKAIQLEPGSVPAHFRLATLYRGLGKKDEAKAEFDKASSLNKKTDDSLLQRITEANAKKAPGTNDAEKDAPASPNR